MKRLFYAILTCLLMVSTSCSSSDSGGSSKDDNSTEQSTTHFSATWVTNVGSPVLMSREAIKACVATCKQYHINNIFMCVWNKGQTLYPSDLMEKETGVRQMPDFAGRDPLKEMIEEAHKENIKVHAWFEYGFASGNGQAGPLLTANPEWASADNAGNALVKNNFHWMNPFMPEVQQFMISLVKEVVQNYDIDGIQGDDRMPALPVEGGYDDYTKQLYRSETGNDPPVSNTNEAWVNWRCDKLTQFQATLYKEVKQLKSSVIVSCAPSIYPWGKQNYLQDWPTWLSNGYADYIVTQVYSTNLPYYHRTVAQQASAVKSALRDKLYIGILIKNGDYTPDASFVRQMVETNRSNSIRGESFWYYDGIAACKEFFESYK